MPSSLQHNRRWEIGRPIADSIRVWPLVKKLSVKDEAGMSGSLLWFFVLNWDWGSVGILLAGGEDAQFVDGQMGSANC